MDNSMSDNACFTICAGMALIFLILLAMQVNSCNREMEAFRYINKQLELEHQLKTQTKP